MTWRTRSDTAASAAYNQSKLANVLFVRELAARGADVGVRAHAVDPGLVDTGIGAKHSGPVSRLVWGARRRRGALTRSPRPNDRGAGRRDAR